MPFRVDVVMAVHNGQRYLNDALASVLLERDVRLIVVDDASTDDTLRILLSWPGRFAFERGDATLRILRNDIHFGLTASLIRGIGLCDSSYIARQDADDFSLPGRFRRQADYLDAHPLCSLVASRVQIIDEAGEIIRRGCQVRWFPKVQMRFGRNPIVHGSAMFRRRDYDAVGGYREMFERSQDLDLWLRLAKVGGIHILPDELYCLREHESRISVQFGPQQMSWAQVVRWASRHGKT